MEKYASSKGQEATEFVLIAVLVFFASLLTVMIFGKQLASFFTSDSSAVNASKTTTRTNLITKDYKNEYSYTGTIQQPVRTIPNANGTETIIINGITVSNIPSSTSQAIKTTGSSGTTDNIIKTLESLIAQLDTLAKTDPAVATLANKAKALASEGYLVADAEEWYEVAAQRLNSSDGLEMPADNKLCEYGEIVGSTTSCDHTVSSQNFIYSDSGNSNIKNLLTTHLENFVELNNQLQSQSAGLQSQQAKDIVNIIKILSGEIKSIATNVQSSVDINNQTLTGIDDLNNKVASQATDLKSQIIESTGTRLSTTNASQ